MRPVAVESVRCSTVMFQFQLSTTSLHTLRHIVLNLVIRPS
jgi:hypothetical protein